MKGSRPLALFLSVLILIISLSFSVSAESGNLINSDLSTWETYGDCKLNKQGSYYYIYSKGSSLNGQYVHVAVALDDTKIVAGDSYSLNFVIPSYDSISVNLTETEYYNQFDDEVGYLCVGLGYLDADGDPIYFDDYYQKLTSSDFKNYADKEYTYTFTVDKISGTPYLLIGYLSYSPRSTAYVFLGAPTLVNNNEADEAGFFEKLKALFDDVGTWFSDLGDKFQLLMENWGENLVDFKDSVSTWFSNLWTNIKGAFDDSVSNVTNNFNNLDTGLSGWFGDLTTNLSNWVAEQKAKLDELGDKLNTKIQELQEKFTEFFDKFKPRVYEEFDWKHAYLRPSDGSIWDGSNAGQYYLITDLFSFPSDVKYKVAYEDVNFQAAYIYYYDLEGNYLGTYHSSSTAFEDFELSPDYQYRFSIRSVAPKEEDVTDLCNGDFKVYVDEGWINGALHNIKKFLKSFGNFLLYFVWDDKPPENPFKSVDGPLDKVEGFFDDLIDYLSGVGEDFEHVMDSITGPVYLLDQFTKRFEWILGILVFTLLMIVVSRFIGI